MDSKDENDNLKDEALWDDDFEESDSTIEDKLKKIKGELSDCRQEKKEYLMGWQRAKADFINLKKEEEKRRAEVGKNLRSDIFSDLLVVLDGFEMAFSNKEQWEKVDENWRIGVTHLRDQLMSALSRHGLQKVDVLGEVFSESVHQAVGEEEVVNLSDDGRVVKVLQSGYVLNGSLLRPARVIVGKLKDN